MTLGVVPLAKFAITGTEEVAATLRPLIPEHDAILMANHGAVTCGKDLTEAFLKMETLEHIARISLAVHQFGSPSPIGREQLERLLCAKDDYMQNAMR